MPKQSEIPRASVQIPVCDRSQKQWLLAVVIVFLFGLQDFAQTLSPVTISGTVRNQSGQPITDVVISVQEKEQSTPILTKTSAEGVFILSAPRLGTYILKARKAGWRDSVMDNLVLSVAKTEVNLILEKAPDSPSSEMELSDQPNFTVAGVTDSSQAGGHGSDAGLRTSESLARQTVALKPKTGEITDQLLANDVAGRKLAGSENELRSGLAQAPGSFDANRRLGEFYFLSGKYREAVPLLEAANQIKSGDFPNNYDLALAYRENGDYAKAREQVQRMLTMTDKAELHALLGNLDERLGDSLVAVQEYERAARMDPSEPNYFEWGSELLLHRAIAPATEVFTKGTNLHPDSVRMMAGLGASLYAGGVYEQAANRVCAASDLKPDDPNPYLFLGKMEETAPAPLPCVEQKMARFVQTQPTNALAHYYYALVLMKRAKESGDPAIAQPAEALLVRALTIDPKLGQACLQLGNLYSGRNDYAKAISSYQKAIEIAPQLSEAHYRLGVAYQRIGDQTKAQQEFKTHQQVERDEAAAVERQRHEVQQFLIVLKDQQTIPQK